MVGNPANTNACILSKYAPSIPKENFSCMTRLDQNRAQAQVTHTNIYNSANFRFLPFVSPLFHCSKLSASRLQFIALNCLLFSLMHFMSVVLSMERKNTKMSCTAPVTNYRKSFGSQISHRVPKMIFILVGESAIKKCYSKFFIYEL